MTFQGQLKRLYKYRANKRPISPFLEVGFEKFFDSHMQEYIGKLKMTKSNRFDTDCKMNELFSPAALASQLLWHRRDYLGSEIKGR